MTSAARTARGVRTDLVQLQTLVAKRDLPGAREQAVAILADDRDGGDASLAGAISALASIAWDEGRVIDAVGLARAAVTRADLAPLDLRRRAPRVVLAAMLVALGDFAEVEAVLHGCDVCERDRTWIAAPELLCACLSMANGRRDEAEEAAARGHARAHECGDEFFAAVAERILAMLAVRRGDERAAAEHLARSHDGEPADGEAFGFVSHQWTEARVLALQGDLRGSLEILTGTGTATSKTGNAFPRLLVEQSAAAAWVVRIARMLGDESAAEQMVAIAERAAVRNPDVATLVTAARHARALLCGDAEQLGLAALEHKHVWARGSAYEDAGSVLVDVDRTAARAAFECAQTTYDVAGCDADTARVRARMLNLATRSRRRRRRVERPRWGWVSLTNTECLVAREVAEGLTNAGIAEHMFLSRHTVDFHLRQIYRKLDIKSRVELTRLVLEHDGPRAIVSRS